MSTHLAVFVSRCCVEWLAHIRTQDSVFILSRVVEVEELSCTKGKDHTFVVFL